MGINTSAEEGMSQGFLHCVKEYGCRVEVRGEGRRETVLREMEAAKEIFARFD